MSASQSKRQGGGLGSQLGLGDELREGQKTDVGHAAVGGERATGQVDGAKADLLRQLRDQRRENAGNCNGPAVQASRKLTAGGDVMRHERDRFGTE